MSLILPKTCSMGGSKTGLVGTIGVTLLNPDGTVHTARDTASIYEIGGGCYGKEITFDDNWKGSIKWDTGGGSPVYATEDYDVEGLIDMIEEDTSELQGLISASKIAAQVKGMDASVVTATVIAADAIGASEFAQAAADKVWATAARALTDKAGFALSSAADNAIADQVWDEILTGATHNIATSAGKRLRQVGAYAIHDGTAQAGTSTTITLAASASSDDGIYNRNLIVIVDGTGLGQTRTIADYDATTKVCVIDREWRINPNNTSEYQILSDDTPLIMDHGIARAGTATTITLRDYASSVDDIYTCNMVAIVGGTGRGQSRLVYSYDGTTKVVTICGKDWTTIPDTTSVYMLVPYGTTCTSCLDTHALDLITDAVWDEPKSDHETSGTTGEYLTKIYNAAKKIFIRAGRP